MYADNVSNIHNRFSLTLINPASHYFSLAGALAAVAAAVAAIHIGYIGDASEIQYRILAAAAVLAATQLLDTRFTRKKEYSKSLHSSLFGVLLWTASILAGLAAGAVLGTGPAEHAVVLGLLLYAGFRIGIYTTTLGAGLGRAWAICMVQPLAVFLVAVPQESWTYLADPLALGFGGAFMVIASVWSVMTDRAGRPGMHSTHKTIQAYLASQGGDHTDAEEIMEGRSSEASVTTSQIRLESEGGEFRMVLPEIHPGPYHPVGGSNIPYLIYEKLSSSAMVMHSISDHALNLPSRDQVSNYLGSLGRSSVREEGLMCTEPVSVRINRASVTGLRFEGSPLLFLSLSPHGMEDIPSYMKTEIEQYAGNRGYSGILVVDCHNAMGEEISGEDGSDMLKAAKSCLDTLLAREDHAIEFGYANSAGMDLWAEDLGLGGLGVLCLRINGSEYYLGWADANNMENGTREEIISRFGAAGMNLLEFCTSDTHYARVKVRNRNGYYQLGLVTGAEKLAGWLLGIAGEARSRVAPCRFQILENRARVKVMGHGIYEDYSRALDNSLRITKWFLVGGLALFIGSLAA
ncbi:MAG: DUF2070 family protein [Nitrosopumilus sp.]|nr:DUF2070 family protein [Nitrosopumilus sp.]